MGGREGKPGGRAFGHAGRASFTLYVLLGPSLAIALALAGFSLIRDAGGQSTPSASPFPSTASPSILGSIPPQTLPGPAPTAAPTQTTSPTIAPVPSLSAPPTPEATKTPPLPTLPPIPTIPHGLP